MIRVAAVADVHLGEDLSGRFRESFADIADRADLLLVAGDLTRHGTVDEGRIAAEEFTGLDVPVVAVLGNHDYHSDAQKEITVLLEDAGVRVLEGDGVVLQCGDVRVGVAGGKGFGGGFAGRCGTEFGEPEMKAFIRHTRVLADQIGTALRELPDADHRVALTHYAPVDDTLAGEPAEIYPFLGSYLLGEAIDDAGADLAIHGHAHAGSEKGVTPAGVRVRNVALPVIRRAYAVYRLGTDEDD